MKKIYLILCLLISFSSYADIDSFSKLRTLPGFSAEIPLEVCNTVFSNHKLIPIQLKLSNKDLKFNLYTFTAYTFNEAKKSILVLDGGPGSLRNFLKAKELSDIFPNYNVVYLHNRGGGCSGFSDLDQQLDQLITPKATIGDLEEIRKAYGIKSWLAVIGFSYGTDIGRLYAKTYPAQIENLILEGLSASFSQSASKEDQEKVSTEDDSADESYRKTISSVIQSRYKLSSTLKFDISKNDYAKFSSELMKYLNLVSPYNNYDLLGYWEVRHEEIVQLYSQMKLPLPDYLNRKTFAAVTSLLYSGPSDEADNFISVLLTEFGYIPKVTSNEPFIESWANELSYHYYPFLNPDFIDYFIESTLISLRIQYAMNASDEVKSVAKLCNDVSTIVINGSDDGSTPVENVENYLKNKTCARGKGNQALIVEGGGHMNLSKVKCLQAYVNQTLAGSGGDDALKACEVSIELKKY